MFISSRWSHLVASALSLTVATASLADDVFVKEGVVVKPLPKWKQRQLERKLLRRPGSSVVVEGAPAAVVVPEPAGNVKVRRAFRPLFGDRLARRPEVVVGAPVVSSSSSVVTNSSSPAATPGVIVSTPRVVAPGDPQVIPGSVEVTPTPRVVRPPVASTPREPSATIEPMGEPQLEPEQPAPGQILPVPADEIPPPVVSTPRQTSSSTKPTPQPVPVRPQPAAPTPDPVPAPAAPAPSVDPGPAAPTPSSTPPPAPEPEPTLELPAVPRPA